MNWNWLRHVKEQPFIVAVGFAAGVHSTWTLATMFGGDAPSDPLAFAYWLVPALLIAFALDIGQISTAYQLRHGRKTWARLATFGVLAAATYYLQWVYIAAHMPVIELSEGVQSFRGPARSFLDLGVWILPALLPISTILYTASDSEPFENPTRAATYTNGRGKHEPLPAADSVEKN